MNKDYLPITTPNFTNSPTKEFPCLACKPNNILTWSIECKCSVYLCGGWWGNKIVLCVWLGDCGVKISEVCDGGMGCAWCDIGGRWKGE